MNEPTQLAITDMELKVLQGISVAIRKSSPTSPGVARVAEASGVCTSAAGKYMQMLEAKRFIQREKKPGSPRRKYRGTIQFTDKGKLALMAAERRNS